MFKNPLDTPVEYRGIFCSVTSNCRVIETDFVFGKRVLADWEIVGNRRNPDCNQIDNSTHGKLYIFLER